MNKIRTALALCIAIATVMSFAACGSSSSSSKADTSSAASSAAEESKAEESKAEESKAEESKAEESQAEAPAESQAEESQAEAPAESQAEGGNQGALDTTALTSNVWTVSAFVKEDGTTMDISAYAEENGVTTEDLMCDLVFTAEGQVVASRSSGVFAGTYTIEGDQIKVSLLGDDSVMEMGDTDGGKALASKETENGLKAIAYGINPSKTVEEIVAAAQGAAEGGEEGAEGGEEGAEGGEEGAEGGEEAAEGGEEAE